MMAPVSPPRRGGIIAAGRGERLSGIGTGLKPLVPIDGEPLIDRVLASFVEAAIERVAIIINEASTAVREHVDARPWPFRIDWIVRTTPSSMHSFLLVLEALADGDAPALVSTVDTVVPPGAFAHFTRAAALSDADVSLAVTRHVDDEKPLLVTVERFDPVRPMRVTALGESTGGPSLATAGYYLVRRSVLAEAEGARRDGVMALRTFFARLLAARYRVEAMLAPDSVDVDRPADVDAAERIVRAHAT